MAAIKIDVGLGLDKVRAGAQQAASEIKTALNGISPSAQKAGRDVRDALSTPLDDLTRKVSKLGSAFGALAGLGIGAALVGVGKAAFDAAVQLDKSRQTIAALTGSVDSANRKLAELRQLAQSSPGVTTSFAADLFAQFKAVGGVADESINRIIKSIGRLNAAFTLPDPQQFARNLQQIFTQGFERADIKEALGQVPIFEQILEQSFGTKDPNKLRALKESGKLTLSTYLDGLSNAIQTDTRFATIQESLGARFSKATESIVTALAPIGDNIALLILPAIESISKTLSEAQDEIVATGREVSGLIGNFASLGSTVGGILPDFLSLKNILGGIALVLAGINDIIEQVTATFKIFAANTVDLLRDTLGAIGIQFDALNNLADRLLQQAEAGYIRLRQGFINVENTQQDLGRGRLPTLTEEQRRALEGVDSGAAITPARITPARTAAGGVGGGGGDQRRALEDARRFKDAQLSLERERVESLNRILDAEGKARLDAYKDQYEAGLLSFRAFSDAKIQIQEESTQREIALLQLEATQLEAARSTARGAEKIQIEEKLLKIYTDQQVKVLELTSALQSNYAEYIKRNALPAFDLDKTPQETVLNTRVDPLIEQAQARITAIQDQQAAGDLRIIQLRRQQLEIENAIEIGLINEADGRQAINAVLREQRDIQIAILEARRAASTDAFEIESINEQIAGIRTLGVELTNAQRFMKGFGSQVESVGDIFDRFGANVARAFSSVKGLLDNLKNAVKQFFQDLLGNALQRVFSGILGSLFGGGGGGRIGGGGSGGSFLGNLAGGLLGGGGGGGLLGSFGGFGGGTFGGSVFGGQSGGGGGLLGNLFGGLFGGGGPVAPGGFGTPPFNPAIFAPANQGILGGLGGAGGASGGILGNLGNLFGGLGFGRAPGTGGAIAGLLPLLGISLGSGLGGQSTLGRILGGVGGGLLGIGLSAAPAALASGSFSFLAPLFSNPITAIIGAALLPGAWLLGRAKQRKADEEQSGVWLQAAVDQIMALKETAKAGTITKDQAKQVFETQILATFTSLIQTLKTKSVRESRLTNQVRDLRNLFEKEVLAIAPDQLKSRTSSSLNLIPEFATGGVVPGVDRGIDSVLAYVRPGEMVLTKSQQSAIQRTAGYDVFARVGVPDSPQSQVAGQPAFASGGIVPMRGGSSGDAISIDLTVDMRIGRDDATRMFVVGASSSDGRRVIVGNVKRARLDKEI